MTITHVVPDDADGRRLDVVLADLLGVSRSRAAGRIAAGEVLVDGAQVSKGATVTRGSLIDVHAPPVADAVVAPAMPPIRYRDEHLLVIAKPAGLVVHAGAGHRGDTLVDACRAEGIPLAEGDDPDRPGVVHRLDRDTSGLLLLASTHEALVALSEGLRDRTIGRRYLALTTAVPADPRGRIEAPIGRDPRQRTRFAVVHGGRPSVTRYRVLESASIALEDAGRAEVASLVCELETGRTHQIRVHLAAVGAPIAGDPLYVPRPRIARALGLGRPALHATGLSLVHPVTGETLAFEEPLPDDLMSAYERAGLTVPAEGVRA